jgi:hypothetical protein
MHPEWMRNVVFGLDLPVSSAVRTPLALLLIDSCCLVTSVILHSHAARPAMGRGSVADATHYRSARQEIQPLAP